MNPGDPFVVFSGIKVSAKTSAQETHVQGKQLRTSFSTVLKGNFLRYWRGGGSMIRMGQSCFDAVL